MTALPVSAAQPRSWPGAFGRWLAAGTAWGIACGSALAIVRAADGGGVCLDDALLCIGVSVAAGLLAIGPLAAARFRR